MHEYPLLRELLGNRVAHRNCGHVHVASLIDHAIQPRLLFIVEHHAIGDGPLRSVHDRPQHEAQVRVRQGPIGHLGPATAVETLFEGPLGCVAVEGVVCLEVWVFPLLLHDLFRWVLLNANAFVIGLILREARRDDMRGHCADPLILRVLPASVVPVRRDQSHGESRLVRLSFEAIPERSCLLHGPQFLFICRNFGLAHGAWPTVRYCGLARGWPTVR